MGNRKNIGVEVGSILVFALGVFSLVSLATYAAADPSLFSVGAQIPQNACGRLGAQISSLLFQFFGLGAFLFPVAFFFIAATLYKQEDWVRVMGQIASMVVAVGSLTVFFSLHWKSFVFGGGSLLTGGALGTWIAQGLIHRLNPFGSSLVVLVIFALAIAVATPMSVAHWGAQSLKASGIISWRVMRLAARYMAYQAGMFGMRFLEYLRDRIRVRQSLQGKKSENETAVLLEAQEEPVLSNPPIGPEKPFEVVQPPVPVRVPDTELSRLVEKEAVADEPVFDSETSSHPMAQSSQKSEIKILPRESDSAARVSTPAKPPRSLMKFRKGNWQLPTIEFLKKPPAIESTVDRSKLIANSQILRQKFADFGIDGEVTAVRPGPVITLYEFKPGPGVKVSRIAALADDLSMALSAQSVRILAPLPGKAVVGIEIPSESRETVFLREFLQHPDFYGPKHGIPVVMGKDIGGQTYLSDLARMPHLLCAGQTGSGKSVFMNGLICSLFYRFTPDELRMILVDPKFIEFRAYQDIPHLLLPVVDDPKHASIALKWAVREMERRYRLLAKLGVRNLASFNQKVEDMGADVVKDLLFAEDQEGESSHSTTGTDWLEAFEPDETGAPKVGKLANIVIIIDELADLMMIAKKEVEISIARIAQKARAAGIHLVIATQRPSTDVITGLIKANLPSRVSFQLASFIDSKTILDKAGAERLLGQGDMLFIPPGVSQTVRLHGAYLDDDEINKITAFLKSQGKPIYRDEILLADDEEDSSDGDEGEDADELLNEAIELIKRSGHASASFLQRHLKVGYNRAARMIETMESRGIVGPQDGARPREVLVR